MGTSWPSHINLLGIRPLIKKLNCISKYQKWFWEKPSEGSVSFTTLNNPLKTTSTRMFKNESYLSHISNGINYMSNKSQLESTLAKYNLNFDAIKKFALVNDYSDSDDDYNMEFTILKYLEHENLIEYDLFRDISNSIVKKSEIMTQPKIKEIMRILNKYKYLNPNLLMNLLDKFSIHTEREMSTEDCLDMLEVLSYQNLRWKSLSDKINDNYKDYFTITKNSVKLLYFYALLDEKTTLIFNQLLTNIYQKIEDLEPDDILKTMLSIYLLEIENDNQNLLSLLLQRIGMINIKEIQWKSMQDKKNIFLLKLSTQYLSPELHFPRNIRNVITELETEDFELKTPKRTKFLQTFSELLQKLQIAHFCHFNRPPYVFDILERDRKIIWNLNTYDRYYANSVQLKSYEKLKKRIAETMGFTVIDCPYWHWSKMKVKRTRIEYIRMSRYYALRDRREFEKNFEGWSLPYIHQIDPRSKNIYHKNYNPERLSTMIY